MDYDGMTMEYQWNIHRLYEGDPKATTGVCSNTYQLVQCLEPFEMPLDVEFFELCMHSRVITHLLPEYVLDELTP